MPEPARTINRNQPKTKAPLGDSNWSSSCSFGVASVQRKAFGFVIQVCRICLSASTTSTFKCFQNAQFLVLSASTWFYFWCTQIPNGPFLCCKTSNAQIILAMASSSTSDRLFASTLHTDAGGDFRKPTEISTLSTTLQNLRNTLSAKRLVSCASFSGLLSASPCHSYWLLHQGSPACTTRSSNSSWLQCRPMGASLLWAAATRRAACWSSDGSFQMKPLRPL